MSKKPEQPPPFHWGPPQKTNWIKILLFVTFIVIGIAAIVVMYEASPRMPELICRDYNGSGLWNAFGRCKTE
jgi:hypothetical protein